jgi:hypothetical protein
MHEPRTSGEPLSLWYFAGIHFTSNARPYTQQVPIFKGDPPEHACESASFLPQDTPLCRRLYSAAILFFALTGTLQTFSLHEAARDGSYKPAQWIVILAQIHKKQTAVVPQRKVPVAPAAASLQKKADPTTPPDTQGRVPIPPSDAKAQPFAGQTKNNPLPLRFFFMIVGLSLFASTASGLYLAWKYRRDRIVIAVLVLAGILAPLALMQL